MKIPITEKDIQTIASSTAHILERYIKAARDYPIPAGSIEGIIEQGIVGWVEGRVQRDTVSVPTTSYDDHQPTDSVYGC